jgi:hypothetical protein
MNCEIAAFLGAKYRSASVAEKIVFTDLIA